MDMKQTFFSPPDEFSPVPFWFWNDELDLQELKRQLLDFYEKGIRGFVIHPRKGLPESTPYLSEAFLDYVEYIVEEAEKLGMKVFLYDEAMYPSGSCHGQVVKTNPSFAAKGLSMHAYEPDTSLPEFGENFWFVAAVLTETFVDGTRKIRGYTSMESLTEAYEQSENEKEAVYFTLVYSKGTIRGIHDGEDDEEPFAPKAADLLDQEAMQTFIRLTHQVYYQRLKKYFGTTIVSIFTDEPSIMGRNHIPGIIPWTHGFLERYLKAGGLITDIPKLFLKNDRTYHEEKQVYKRALNQLLEESFFRPISQWCEEHGIQLSGHPSGSEDIGVLKHFQLPCQDIVWRYIDPDLKNGLIGGHSSMGKCSSDAARHSGKRRNGNECFGACGHKDDPWNFPFTDMKWYMNWLFARGVNLLIPHAFYYSLREERVNERPPDVGPNSPWWENYQEIATYIRRMCWLNTDSVNVTDIAVLCNGDHLPWKPVKALYENQIEFNYLETELLKECCLEDHALKIRKQSYQVILIEKGLRICMEEQEILDLFEQAGGKLLYIDGECDESIVSALRTYNSTALKPLENPADLRISHVIKEGKHFYLLFNESGTECSFEANTCVSGKKEIWDPWKGTFDDFGVTNKTMIKLDAYQALILTVE